MGKRAKLIEAAAEEFVKYGMEELHLKKIAERIGLKKSDVGDLFGQSEISRKEIQWDACNRFLDAIGSLPEAGGVEKYRRTLGECRARITRFFEDSPASALLVLFTMGDTNGETISSARNLKAGMKRLLLQGQKLGLVRQEVSADMMLTVICSYMKAMSQIVAWQHGSPSRMSPPRARGLARTIFDMNMRIMGPVALGEAISVEQMFPAP